MLFTAIGWFAGCVAPLMLPVLPAPRLLLATACLLAATGLALRQWPVQHLIASGAQRHQVDLKRGVQLAQPCRDMFALPKGERALAGGDA